MSDLGDVSDDSDDCTHWGNIPSQPFRHHFSPPDPTLGVLSSFNTYSSAQKEKFASTAASIKEEQSKMDDVIDRTQAYLKYLLSEREKLSSALDKQQSLLAPIRDLPDEILCEVFLCLQSLWGCDFATNKPPLLLMYVCRRWRALATSIQALWSHIYVDDCPPPIWLLDEFLTRSRGHPLTINMHCTQLHRMSRAPLHPTLTTLIKHIPRWRTIKFALASEFWKEIATLPPSVRTFPMLQSVNLSAIDDCSGDLWKIFENAPSLRDASVRCTPVRGTGTAVHFILPLSQLQSYAMLRSSVGECLCSFGQCPNLISCTVECITLGDSSSIETHQRMGQLEFLAITVWNQSYFSFIFDFSSAPVLKDLRLFAGTIDNVMENVPISVIPFLAKSSCNLEKLTLSGLTLAGGELINILQHLPCLAELVVAQHRKSLQSVAEPLFTEEVFHRLASTSLADGGAQDHPIIVPGLRSLWFTGQMDVSDRTLLSLMQSRLERRADEDIDHPVARFKYVFLDIWRSIGDSPLGSHIENKVALWREQGLEVEIQVEQLGVCPIKTLS